jgi:hypothetical protein
LSSQEVRLESTLLWLDQCVRHDVGVVIFNWLPCSLIFHSFCAWR